MMMFSSTNLHQAKIVLFNIAGIFCVVVLLLLIKAIRLSKESPETFSVDINSKNLTVHVKSKELTVDIEYVENHLLELDQKDPELIRYSRIKYLTPPSKLPYVFDNPNAEKPMIYADIFSKWIANLYKNKTHGIFIEAGAHEGENPSHTLMLELDLKWTGLLVECNPTLIPVLRKHHRKAWIADVCLAPKRTPGVHNFFNANPQWSQTGQLETKLNKPLSKNTLLYEVYSVPLYTLIAAIGWTEIDYFTLDVEGAELEILQTFPFDIITIKVLTVEEYYHLKRGVLQILNDLLEKNGLHFVRKINDDRVYVHSSMMKQFLKMSKP